MTAYGARPVKRHRASRTEIAERRNALVNIITTDGPMSVRQAYYRAVVAGIVPKNDAGYRRVQREVLNMRRDGALPYSAIVDNTRWMRKPQTWDSAKDALTATARVYRQALWSSSHWRLEVWCESDSIAGSIGSVTEDWDIPLMPTRGFSSETFAYSAAESWAEDYRSPVVLYVGDHDPHGLEIEAALRDRLRTFAGFEAEWHRIGVTWDQVEDLDLPGTQPKKSYGYPRAVEAEALPPQMLRDLLEETIRDYVDEAALDVLLEAERSEREVLERIAETAGAA